MNWTLEQIAEVIGGTVHGDLQAIVYKIQRLDLAKDGDLSFLSQSKYEVQLPTCLATAVIVQQENIKHCPKNAIVVADPYVAYAKAAQFMDQVTPKYLPSIASSACIHNTAQIGNRVFIGENVVIEANARIGDDVVIGHNCVIGRNAKIGEHTRFVMNVSFYHDCEIGAHGLVHANTVIGSDGFGYANQKGEWIKIPQVGRVVIGDRVEIGAGVAIDRGAIDDTIIQSNVIIDNQVHIAHNVEIGTGTAIAAGVGIAGSTKIGRYNLIGGNTGFAGHITTADNVTFTGMSMVTKTVKESGSYSSGLPAEESNKWRKNIARIRRLEKTEERLRKLEQK